MSEHTKKLLRECNSGCKMAINSMDQVLKYVENPKLEELIVKYKKKHEDLESRAAVLLDKIGEPGQEPGVMASAFSWTTTEMKMAMNDSRTEIAKIMMDGCNMGIQSIGEYLHKYDDAEEETRHLAKDLIKAEEAFLQELEMFL